MGGVQGRVHLSPAAGAWWRMQAAPGDYSRQMLQLSATNAG